MKILQIRPAFQPRHGAFPVPAEVVTDPSAPWFALLIWHNRCFLLCGSPERSSENRPSGRRRLAKAQRPAGRPKIGLFVPPVALRRLQHVAVLKIGRSLKDEARDQPRACACSPAIARPVNLSFRPDAANPLPPAPQQRPSISRVLRSFQGFSGINFSPPSPTPFYAFNSFNL